MKAIRIILLLIGFQVSNVYSSSPEFYGIYADNNNKLTEMSVKNTSPYEFGQKVQFLVFQKQAEMYANGLTIERAIFVRTVNNPGVDGREPPKDVNTWKPRLNGAVETRTKPVTGQPEQIYVVPRSPLTAGMYIVSIGDREIGRFYVDKKRVTQNFEQGENCIDISVPSGWASMEYDLSGAHGKTTPCSASTEARRLAAAEEVRRNAVAVEERRKAAEQAALEAKEAMRFKDNGDGTVTDNATNLIWSKNANINNGMEKRDGAIEYMQQLNNQKYAGYSDWRLPTSKEFNALIEFARTKGERAGILWSDDRYDYFVDNLFSGIGFVNFYHLSASNAHTYHEYWISNSDSGSCKGLNGHGGTCSGYLYVWPVRVSNLSTILSPTAKQFTFIGNFSGDTANCATDSSSCMYRVELWRDTVAGVVGIMGYPVAEADTPTRFIEQVKYDSTSGTLSFEATYAEPYVWGGPGSVAPQDKDRDHEKLKFAGTLIGDTLKGTFTTYSDKKGAPREGWKGKIVLLKKDKINIDKEEYLDIATWEKHYSSFIPAREKFRSSKK